MRPNEAYHVRDCPMNLHRHELLQVVACHVDVVSHVVDTLPQSFVIILRLGFKFRENRLIDFLLVGHEQLLVELDDLRSFFL